MTKVDSFDVTNEPLVAVTNLEKFLNLDPEISEKNFIYNSTKVRIFNLKNHFTLLVSKMSKIIEKISDQIVCKNILIIFQGVLLHEEFQLN